MAFYNSFSGSNPYLQSQANAVSNQVTGNLQRNILPQINNAAMQAGGYGGSRQGVLQANARPSPPSPLPL